MSRTLHTIRMGALALSLAGLLANCGGGGGGDDGGNSLRLFFGMNGNGSCNNVVVNVDLADAEAVLARKNGNPDCTIDLGLANAGCLATFTELNDGEDLRVTIAGCTIPAVTNLFSCLFEDVDLSDLVTESNAQCACTVPGCDGTPPLCIDEDIDPRSCEDCDNGSDDDGDGLADCDDPKCEHAPECNTVTTTTVTSTTESTVTTTTEAATTTTTLPPEPISINFALSAPSTPLATLQFTVNYTSAPGDFEGGGTSVLCESAVDDALFAANNNEQSQKLTLGWVSLDGFGAPTALVSCQFMPDTPVPVPANFTVVIDEATDLDGERVRGVNITVTVTGVP